MKINPRAKIDRSQVQDRRGQRSRGFPMPGGRGGGGGLPIPAGGGIGGIILVIVILVVASQCGGLSMPGGSDSNSSAQQLEECRTGADAAKDETCLLNLFANVIQTFWADKLPGQADVKYVEADTVFLTDSTDSGCGQATSAMGPFYCPADKLVYLDPTFFKDMLQGELGAKGGPFAEGYVVAHEYGHHVQDLLGTMQKAQSGETGPTSPSVRLELQADCYAGIWAHYATTVKDDSGEVFITDLTDEDIKLAIDAAKAVGDDRIQQRTQGNINEEQWTHGSSAERIHWFMTGYQKGQLDSCDSFAANAL
ncbi:MAG: neutral zinc metallopeptidase [Nocardioidaceae bacterium]